jgi:DNA-binding NtrC family response regulator
VIVIGKSGKKYISVRAAESEDDLRKQITEIMLEIHRWNISHAADALAVTRFGLQTRMRRWGLRRPGESSSEGSPK